MNPRALLFLATATGLAVGAAGATLLRREPARPIASANAKPQVDATERDDDEALTAANANLVASLQECNRRLSDLGQKRVAPLPPTAQSALASEATPVALRGPRHDRSGREPADWERYTKEGLVPYSIPCIRDTPFSPSQKQLDRIGLAPHDAPVLRDAYAKSNARILAQIQPLCARVLGNRALPEQIGPQACISAIVDGARKANPDKMQEALIRVGEVNAGKRPPPNSTAELDPVEALMLALTAEQKTFESDLGATLGPEDARRVGSSLCMDRSTIRVKQVSQ
jgi:hypothetical protein